MTESSFNDMALAAALLHGLNQAGFTVPTPVQARVIPLALTGRDLLVSAATGSGKTAAFLLPLMQRLLAAPRPNGGTRALVLAPTRELARQIAEHFIKLGGHTQLTVEVITGGESRARQVASLRRNPELLVATPGRLLEWLDNGGAALDEIEMLVLDEADRMLDMGFAEQVLSIIARCNPQRQSLLFSATLQQPGLQHLAERLLRAPESVLVDDARTPHPNIDHQRILSDDPAHKQHQTLALLQARLGTGKPSQAIVFTNSRAGAEALGGWLASQDVRAASIHGELDQRQRKRVMSRLHAGEIDVLVATDLAARGLDIHGVALVINHEIPRNGSDYLHRSGRTGRAGTRGLTVSLVAAPEWNRMAGIARYLDLDLESTALPGLQAHYQGGDRRSGKARSVKPKKSAANERPVRQKQRLRDRKNIGKRRQPSQTRDDTTPANTDQIAASKTARGSVKHTSPNQAERNNQTPAQRAGDAPLRRRSTND